MTIASIRAALETRLATISALYAMDVAPPQITQHPAAVVIPVSGIYGTSFGGGNTEHRMMITVLVTMASGLALAQTKLDGFLTPTGANSIKAAIEADPDLNGAACSTSVLGYHDYGIREWPGDSGQFWLAADIDIEVYE